MAGRPKIEVTDELCEKAETLAAEGLTKEQIALNLGFSYDTLSRREKESAVFAEAIKKGQAKGIHVATSQLMILIQKGNLGAICFYLKNRDSGIWKDRVPEGADSDTPEPKSIEVTIFDGRKPKFE